MNRFRWAWFALACLVAAGWAWTSRYEYHDCHRGVCVAVNRWTGELHRAETATVTSRREMAAREERSRDSLAALGLDTAMIAEAALQGDAHGESRWARYAEQ